jgi:hypothetical protein
VYNIDDIWGCDLVEMQEWKDSNDGYRYILNCIDVYSKYAWAVPLKDKKGETILQAFKNIIKKSGRSPKRIWVDHGGEFYNKLIDKWLAEQNIIRYSTYSESKSCVVERFNRTLKENMWRQFTAQNTRNWISMLDDLISTYNNRVHSTIKMKPIDVTGKNPDEMPPHLRQFIEPSKNSGTKFKVDDTVRISRVKGIFEPGYLPNWSEEIYTISEVKLTNPVTYIIKDANGEIIEGSFYNQELQATSQEVFRIEKIIRKKKIKGVLHGLVKWIGYNHSHNQWIPMTEIQAVP